MQESEYAGNTCEGTSSAVGLRFFMGGSPCGGAPPGRPVCVGVGDPFGASAPGVSQTRYNEVTTLRRTEL